MNNMIRLLWLAGLAAAAVVPAELQQQNHHARIAYNTKPETIDDSEMTVATIPLALHPTSHLLNTTDSNALQKRKDVSVTWSGSVSPGGAVISAVDVTFYDGNIGYDFYGIIATQIKLLSDRNSCQFWWGTQNGNGYLAGYAYQAHSTGKNCGTSALVKTIDAAVRKCATNLSYAQAILGCCNLYHGGTWHGILKLTADANKYPASSATCPP